ncbi:GNAT family N-acetyltransferase [Shouchella lehensis]|uniref:GNAT family N-acetyltransferase n=1 Tax=Shouchella lehensis TaxID=300825 RepID=A0A4Y7WIJ9_9BACI|nr:GNAT family N-acetyltransferase [Shouchella lehensis]MBG9786057.1 GNAT family acetyltransferase [Shouchella lehensis]TES48097.1 GNAT family N-acetyltransferase [Shouchella lehensis]
MIIRRAKLDDAPAIAKVHVDSWKTTYQGIVPNDYLSNLSYQKRTELWKANIAKKDNYVVVAENNKGEIVGFGDAWKRETNKVENSGDLTSIYLLEEYQGEGVGKKLLKALFKNFKLLGYRKIFVEVLEENKTRYFYEYYGAKLVKSVQFIIGGKPLNELIYQWDNIDEVIEKL